MGKLKKSKIRRLIASMMFFGMENAVNLMRVVLGYTYRYESVDEYHRHAAKELAPSGGYLLACWHETVLPVSMAQIGHPFRTLCSRSRSGQCVAFLMKRMGFYPILGSQSSGGKEAREDMLGHLQDGFPGAITVDGSSGPRRYVKPGIVDLARKGNVTILPVFTFSKRAWVLNTWDKLRIPKPFSKIYVLYGSPIKTPDTEDFDYELVQNQIKASLEQLETRIKEEQLSLVKANA